MEKEYLKGCINNGKSIRKIAEENNKSLTTVRYWFKKHGLKSNYLSFKDRGVIDYNGERCCPRCDKTKSTNEFYNRRGKEGASVYCKKCVNKQTTERSQAFKKLIVDYKGGCCERCGYNKSISALEFHHINPEEKDFILGGLKNKVLNDKIKKELNKCIMVCANCHREIHDELKSS